VNTQEFRTSIFRRPNPAGRIGASHRGPLGPADLPVEQHAGVGPPPALQAAPGTRRDTLGAFLVAGATWVADSPQNLPATLKRRPESFRLWRVAGGQDSHLLSRGGRPDSPKDLRAPLAASCGLQGAADANLRLAGGQGPASALAYFRIAIARQSEAPQGLLMRSTSLAGPSAFEGGWAASLPKMNTTDMGGLFCYAGYGDAEHRAEKRPRESSD
jgi:hypothetical protein